MSVSLRIESIRDRKLRVLFTLAVIIQACAIILPGVLTPRSLDEHEWPLTRKLAMVSDESHSRSVVYEKVLPDESASIPVEYSKWQRPSMASLTIRFFIRKRRNPYSNVKQQTREQFPLTMKATLGYKDQGDAENQWMLHRNENFTIVFQKTSEGRNFDVYLGTSPFITYDFGWHDNYTLMIHHVPVLVGSYIPPEISLVVIDPNQDYTQLLILLKTIFCPLVGGLVVWFWKNMEHRPQSSLPISYTLLVLGIMLTFLNLPLEYLRPIFYMRFMVFLREFRHDLFYFGFIIFCLTFTSEHIIRNKNLNKEHSRLRMAVNIAAIGFLTLSSSHIRQRYMSLENAFNFVVGSVTNNYISSYGLLILVGLGAGIFGVIVVGKVYKVFRSIENKRKAVRSSMLSSAELSDAICQRYKCVMIVTMVCVMFTLVDLMIGELAKAQFLLGTVVLIEPSQFTIGVFVMWNLFVMAMLYLYSPTPATASQVYVQHVEFEPDHNSLPAIKRPFAEPIFEI